jgi:hypothetical protein
VISKPLPVPLPAPRLKKRERARARAWAQMLYFVAALPRYVKAFRFLKYQGIGISQKFYRFQVLCHSVPFEKDNGSDIMICGRGISSAKQQ